ncbi:YqhA family protein [Novosphingobium sp.]|uniref:YqhA family protein n=1 Tax=Novosphingobium sp. TaxID=1874826 RepID=UPI00334063A6
MERLLLSSRKLLVVFYLGLIWVLLVLIAKFGLKLADLTMRVFAMDVSELIIAVLKLLDITLVGNLVVIMMLAGYENFVSSIDHAPDAHRPSWMGKVGFGDLKIKLITSIVAISAIQLLEATMNIQGIAKSDLAWMMGAYGLFVVSGVLLAAMNLLSHAAPAGDGAAGSADGAAGQGEDGDTLSD